MKLVVMEEGTRSDHRIDRSVVRIGRAMDNDIRLTVPLASRHHCRLEADDSGVWVVDLESANGTQVNGKRVDRVRLSPGDVLGVGGAKVVVEELGAGAVEESLGEEHPADDAADELATLSGEVAAEGSDLRVFARILRALASETELVPLFRLIVDAAIGLVGAERGFLLLASRFGGDKRPDPSEMNVRVARSFDKTDIPIPSTRVSMGIARQVIDKGRPLLSLDAGRDERLVGMPSVEDLRLRSVLCLPVRIDARVEGVLYVDNRLQIGVFGEDNLHSAEVLADVAAIAIKNARLVAELRERNQRLIESSSQIKSLNEQLGRKIRDRDSELAVVRAELERERGRFDYTNIVGASHEMKRVFHELDRIVQTELPVMIQGESGTGKELIARAIHFNGPRKERPFVVENCAALPDTLLESELFGHTRGAFTGADRSKKGLLEQADGGTLFLDEIGDMSPEMQKKLLRVLQEGEVRPLGSNQTIQVDVRLLAASHQDLGDMVRKGEFREDLYYRVNVLALRLPPLRERREDIPLLAEALLARAAREANREAPILSHEVLGLLALHDWPGNVRELENEMRRALILAEDVVQLEHISPSIVERSERESESEVPGAPVIVGDLRGAVAKFERRAIEEALQRSSGNKSKAAKELGISRFALQRKLEKYGISIEDDEDA